MVGRGPAAVLTETRDNALVTGWIVGLVTALPFVALAVIGSELFWVPIVWTVSGVMSALSSGLTPWLYHHWLRRRWARSGKLPLRLSEFLDWCAAPRQGLLRASDAYEFRHGGLLEYLARETPQ